MIDIRNFKSFSSVKTRILIYFPENYQDEDMIDVCWNWRGYIAPTGYGNVCYGRKHYTASHMSYLTFNGPVRSGQLVRHTCDNRRCVNPKHLILGNHQDNSQDMVRRNRQRSQKLNEEAVKVIKWMLKYKSEKDLIKKLALLHNVSTALISHINTGRKWSWVKI